MRYKRERVRNRDCSLCDGYGVPTDVNLMYCSCLYGMVEHFRYLLSVEPKKRNNVLISKIKENIKKTVLKNRQRTII